MRLISFCLACALLAWTLGAGEKPTGADRVHPRMPESYYVDSTGYPEWVSVSRAVRPNGQIDTSAIRPSAANALDRYIGAPVESGAGCKRVYMQDWIIPDADLIKRERLGPPLGLNEFISRAAHVLVGTVTGKAPGLNGSVPMTLLRIATEQVLRGDQREGSELFVLVPVGEVTIRGRAICLLNPEFAHPLPTVGERVLLLLRDAEIATDDRLVRASPESLVVLNRDQAPRLPGLLRRQDLGPVGEDSEKFLGLAQTALQGDVQ